MRSIAKLGSLGLIGIIALSVGCASARYQHKQYPDEEQRIHFLEMDMIKCSYDAADEFKVPIGKMTSHPIEEMRRIARNECMVMLGWEYK